MGLYDDDNAQVTEGDINDENYWGAKAFSTAVDEALKTRQPEYSVGRLLDNALEMYEEALKTYANHKDLLAWKAKAEEVKGKIDPKAKSESFKPDFPWGDNYYWQGWASINHARMAKEAGDWQTVFVQARNVRGRWYHCTSKAEKAWSDDVKKFFQEGYEQASELQSEANKKK